MLARPALKYSISPPRMTAATAPGEPGWCSRRTARRRGVRGRRIQRFRHTPQSIEAPRPAAGALPSEHRRNAPMERRFVKIEGPGPQGASPSCASPATHQCAQPAGVRETNGAARFRGRSRNVRRDPDRRAQGLLGRLHLKDSEGPNGTVAVGRRAHPSPAARPQDVQGMARDGPGHDCRHRAIASAAARWSSLDFAPAKGRAFPYSRDRLGMNMSWGLDPASWRDGPGAPSSRSSWRRRISAADALA